MRSCGQDQRPCNDCRREDPSEARLSRIYRPVPGDAAGRVGRGTGRGARVAVNLQMKCAPNGARVDTVWGLFTIRYRIYDTVWGL